MAEPLLVPAEICGSPQTSIYNAQLQLHIPASCKIKKSNDKNR